jgi:uncharacterized membrane protein
MEPLTPEVVLLAVESTSETNYTGMIFLLSLVGILLLYLGFKRYKHHLTDVKIRRRAKQIVDDFEAKLSATPSNEMAGSDEFAAIAMVIHLYQNELHDEETAVMTINKIARAYSPWCSKLYFQNQYFNLRRR